LEACNFWNNTFKAFLPEKEVKLPAFVLLSRSPWPVSASPKCVASESYYDIHEDEQNGFMTEGKNRVVCWRRCNSWRVVLEGSNYGTSFSIHSVVNENEYPV
jgi:hypothetical protein